MNAFRFRQLLFKGYRMLIEHMPGGRKPETDDIDILRAMALYPGPGVASTELGKVFDMTQQGMSGRLEDFVEDDLVEYRKIGGTNVYRLTLSGQKFVARRVLDGYEDARQ